MTEIEGLREAAENFVTKHAKPNYRLIGCVVLVFVVGLLFGIFISEKFHATHQEIAKAVP